MAIWDAFDKNKTNYAVQISEAPISMALTNKTFKDLLNVFIHLKM